MKNRRRHMPLIELTDKMSVGVAEIDAEHRSLADAVNRFHAAVEREAKREELSGLLDALVVRTVSHFVCEERLFARTGYPNREAHVSEHEDLKKQILDVRDRFRQGDASLLTPEFARFLKNWLIQHIMTMDKKYGDHLKARGVR
jgi:hemerythrin